VISQAAVTRLASLKRSPINADSLGENLVSANRRMSKGIKWRVHNLQKPPDLAGFGFTSARMSKRFQMPRLKGLLMEAFQSGVPAGW
jgi:hypothetical protein